MEIPPSLTGAEKLITACPAPATTEVIEGADGLFAGTTAEEAITVALEPTLFTARILTEYEVPFDRLEILNGLVTELTAIQFEETPQLETQYSTSEIGAPPFPPNSYETSIARSREETVKSVGASGTVFGVLQTSFDAGPTPIALTARTWTQYSDPLVRSVVPSEDSLSREMLVVVPPPSVRFLQVAPRSVEY